MNTKKTFLYIVILCVGLAACGCTSRVPVSEPDPELTLPPAAQNYVAPIGDAALEYTAEAVLYMPRHNSDHLIAVTSPVIFSASRPPAESLVRALLNHSSTDTAATLGGSVSLSLYGANPVEVSCNVATVNLAASALQLSRGDLYMAFQAIANTLTELPNIDYVNFLVVDRAVGLDIANTLPMGAFSRSLGEDITAVYEQKLTRRVSVNEDASSKTFSANATLYFPLQNTPGVLSEVRTCNFQNQLVSDMVITLLRELEKGPQRNNIDSPALPLLSEMLTIPPYMDYSDALGGQVISLHFSFNLDEMLDAYNLTRANCMASLCYTLSTFFPGIAGITATIGDSPVETLMLTNSFTSSVLFDDYIQQRSDFAVLMYDLCTLYFANEHMTALLATQRPIPYYQIHNPRTLLQELAKGPQKYDHKQGLKAIMPDNSISDADILGLALLEDTMLVNFSQAFLTIGEDMSEQEERMLAYSMVNTLCDDQRIRRVSFFASGAVIEGFSGKIYWAGDFYPIYQ